MLDQARPSRPVASGLRVGVVVSSYHEAITRRLRDGAVRAFREAGGQQQDLVMIEAPGAFELTAVCRALAVRGDLDAVVALGCIIAGETRHDRYLARAVVGGLTAITVQTGMPVAFGVLTCATTAQAKARAGGRRGNKGAEAMLAAIQTALSIGQIEPAADQVRSRPARPAANGQVTAGPTPRRRRGRRPATSRSRNLRR